MTDPASETSQPPQVAAQRRVNRLLGTLVGAAAGISLALAVVVVVMLLRRQPPLTRERFDEQREFWKQHAVPDYDIEVQVTGLRAATYRVQVRGGEAVSATIDGRPLADRRTFATWSVPGMFGTIERDVEAFDRQENGKASPGSSRLTLYATFDPVYGFPRHYQRFEWGEAASGADATWEVTEFTILPHDRPPPATTE